MNTIKNILVPVNFTESSMNAMQSAIAMCKRHDASLHLLNVLETDLLMPTADMSLPALNLAREIELSRIDNMKTYCNAVTRTHNIDCSYSIETGFVPYVICAKAEKLNASLIVMGTDNTCNLFSYFLGSNAYRVLQNAECPVLTIPMNVKALNFNNIVFPVRLVTNSLEKYKFIEPIIQKNQASVFMYGAVESGNSEKFNVLKMLMQKASDNISTTTGKIEYEYYVGDDIAKAVLDKSVNLKANLLVITASLTKSIRRFFFAEYVKQVINNHRTPVLCIKPSRHTEEDYHHRLLMRTPTLA